MASTARVYFLGVRGSSPVEGADYIRYGGSTSSVLVRMGKEVIVLDAGTGLLNLCEQLLPEETHITILLSHPHLDHLEGLLSCPLLFHAERSVTILAAPRASLGAQEQVAALMSRPLWPVGPEAFQARVTFRDMGAEAFDLGGVTVETMEGVHPGGSTVFKLSYRGLSLVYATDYELDSENATPLVSFSGGCSLLLCDGQYTEEEYTQRRGFGHSSWRAAAQLALDCGASRFRVIHHDPRRTDPELDAMERQLREICPRGAFARRGEEIILS